MMDASIAPARHSWGCARPLRAWPVTFIGNWFLQTSWNRDKITHSLSMTSSIILPRHPEKTDMGELHDKKFQKEI
jgi:hypothetical protein